MSIARWELEALAVVVMNARHTVRAMWTRHVANVRCPSVAARHRQLSGCCDQNSKTTPRDRVAEAASHPLAHVDGMEREVRKEDVKLSAGGDLDGKLRSLDAAEILHRCCARVQPRNCSGCGVLWKWRLRSAKPLDYQEFGRGCVCSGIRRLSRPAVPAEAIASPLLDMAEEAASKWKGPVGIGLML